MIAESTAANIIAGAIASTTNTAKRTPIKPMDDGLGYKLHHVVLTAVGMATIVILAVAL